LTSESKHDLGNLCRLSRQIGSDPLQVQGAGGNTSIKIDDTLWIKASGTWLQNAEAEKLFVPVALTALLQSIDDKDPAAEKSTDFVLSELNPDNLRPSIETTVHAVIPQRVVIHSHCVDTIAVAVQEDAEQILTDILKDYRWLWVPYFRPGLPLSRYIEQHRQADTDVVILGNHGLVIAADTIAEAENLMQSVRSEIRQIARPQNQVVSKSLSDFCNGSGYVPANDSIAHSIAFDSVSINIAAAGSLYPDHVIFLGDGTAVAGENESLNDAVNRITDDTGSAPMSLVIPDKGVLMKADANPGQHAMARCIADVTARLPETASIRYLDDQNVYELLNWEAEHYRQKLNTK